LENINREKEVFMRENKLVS